MELARRGLFMAAATLAAFPARAESNELALMCDVTLGMTLRLAADAYRASTGVRITVFPSAPGLIVPMVSRDALIDIVVTRLSTLAQARNAGVLKDGPAFGTWRSPLVVARGPGGGDKFAVSELPDASGIDAEGALAALRVTPDRVVSAIDTDAVAFLLNSGAAGSGLMYLTDAKAYPQFRVVETLTDPPPAVFGAAIAKGSGRPNPAGFLGFLDQAPARLLLSNNGLETVA
jgi:hypothetical protein